MEDKKCIVCGRKDKDTFEMFNETYEVSINEYKFEHGSVFVCSYHKCSALLSLHLNGFAAPVVWLSSDDLINEDLGGIHMTEEEFESLKPEDMIELAGKISDSLFNESFIDLYHNDIGSAVEAMWEKKEREKVKKTEPKGLPLLIGALKYQRNIDLLQKRLKGEE